MTFLGGVLYILLVIAWESFMMIAIMGIISIIGAILEGQSLYSLKYPKGGSVLCLIVGIFSVIPVNGLQFLGIGFIYLNSPVLLTGIIILLNGGIVGLVGALYKNNS
ncbi:MAG: hypothetical protein ACFFCI_24125 [Promethearchaeota archaeon]